MKVIDVERIVVDVPFTRRQQKVAAREVYNWAILELCRVETDSGHVGWGETVIHYTWARVTDAAIERVIGQSPAACMHDDSLGAGLQMALFDAVGRANDVPVHRLLGHQVRDRAFVSWWDIDMPAEDWIAECKDAIAAGYTDFKTKARPWFCLRRQVKT